MRGLMRTPKAPTVPDGGLNGEAPNEWILDDEEELLIISLPTNGAYVVDPNYSNTYGDPQSKKTV